MKLVTAVVKPFKLDEIKEALEKIEGMNMVVVNAQMYDRRWPIYRGAEYIADFQPKIVVDVIIDEDKVEKVVKSIAAAAHTGRYGDGFISVSNIELPVPNISTWKDTAEVPVSV